MNQSPTSERRRHGVLAAFCGLAGYLSLPIAGVAMLLVVSRAGDPVWSFGALWLAFGLAVAGAHFSHGTGRIWGRTTIALIPIGLLFAFLLTPVQQARE